MDPLGGQGGFAISSRGRDQRQLALLAETGLQLLYQARAGDAASAPQGDMEFCLEQTCDDGRLSGYSPFYSLLFAAYAKPGLFTGILLHPR